MAGINNDVDKINFEVRKVRYMDRTKYIRINNSYENTYDQWIEKAKRAFNIRHCDYPDHDGIVYIVFLQDSNGVEIDEDVFPYFLSKKDMIFQIKVREIDYPEYVSKKSKGM